MTNLTGVVHCFWQNDILMRVNINAMRSMLSCFALLCFAFWNILEVCKYFKSSLVFIVILFVSDLAASLLHDKREAVEVGIEIDSPDRQVCDMVLVFGLITFG